MFRRSILAAAALLTASSLAGCGAKNAKGESSLFDESSRVETPASPESLSPAAVKELESIPGLDSDTDNPASESAEKAKNSKSEESEADIEKTAAESVDIGGITLTADEIPFSSVVKLSGKDSGSAVFSDGTMYLLDGKKLREFTVGDEAEETGSTELSGSYSRIDADPYGRIYLSRDRFDCAVIDESGEVRPLDVAGELSMSKVMEYGLCTNGGEITKFTSEADGSWSSVAERELEFPENVSAVEFAGNHILIAHKEDGENSVTVCDYDGNTLVSTNGGSIDEDITAITETAGVIAASSCGDLCLWDDSGDLIGRLSSNDTAKLFGADSPLMINRLIPEEGGSMLAVCSGGKGESEARLYRISGL